MDFKLGDIVKLNDRAKKEFYETNAFLEMFDRPSVGDFDEEGFVYFVGEQISFNASHRGAIVIRILEHNVRVRYYNILTQDYHEEYFDKKHLNKMDW